MSKIKKEEFKERDEIEEYFSEVKNKSFPIGIIFIIVFLALIGGVIYYYFVIDNPKNLFLGVINNTLDKINYQEHGKINYEFSLDTIVNSTNKEYIDIVNIIEDFALTGKGGLDLDNKKSYSELTTYYQSEKLLDLTTYYQFDDYLYLESKDLFDKVIKIKNETEETNNENNSNYNIKIDDLEKLVNSLKEIIKDILDNASYQKEYVDLSGTKVKKITLIVNQDLMENFYNKLLDNNDFLESYSKITDTDKTEVKKGINNAIDKLDDETEKISLYLSIFENEFLMLESIYKKERITITKENNAYNYKIYDDSIIEYQGYIEIEKTNNEYQISFEYDDIKEEINIILNLDLSLDYDKDIEEMDTKDAIDYDKLTENDLNKILNNLSKNKTFTTLSEDLNSLFTEDNSTNQKNLTTTA